MSNNNSNGWKFDPQTGKPIEQTERQAEKGKIVGYDGQTGEPIYEKTTDDWSFDPDTGKRIDAGQQSGAQAATERDDADKEKDQTGRRIIGYDGQTGEPIYGDVSADEKEGKNHKKTIVRIGGIAAAAVVAVIIIGNVTYGRSHGTRIVDGAVKALESVEKSSLGKAVGMSELRDSRTGTIGLDGEFMVQGTDVTANAALSYDFGGKEYSLDGSVGAAGYNADVQLYADKSVIRLSVPALYDRAIFYDYTKDDQNGYLAQAIDSELGEDMSLADLNAVISYALNNSYDDVRDVVDELLDDTKDNLNGLHWKRAAKREFEIDEKEVRCSGYMASVTAKDLTRWIDQYEKTVTDEIEKNKALAEVVALASNLDSAEDISDEISYDFEEAKDELSDLEGSVDISYYIHNGAPAAVCISQEDSSETLEIDFEGGDYTLQNAELKEIYNYEDGTDYENVFLSVDGYTSGSREHWSISIYGTTIFDYMYDEGTGALTMTVTDSSYYGDNSTIEGTLAKEGNGFTYTINDLENEYLSGNCALSVSTDADIQKMGSDSDALDLGSASESELEALGYDIYNAISNFMY